MSDINYLYEIATLYWENVYCFSADDDFFDVLERLLKRGLGEEKFEEARLEAIGEENNTHIADIDSGRPSLALWTIQVKELLTLLYGIETPSFDGAELALHYYYNENYTPQEFVNHFAKLAMAKLKETKNDE